MKTSFLVWIVMLSGLAQGQSGWNFDQTRKATTDIVVADIVEGFDVDSVAEVQGTASIQVVRVLFGKSQPGATLSLQWRYRPSPAERVGSQQFPKIRALFFLKNAGATFEPLRLSGVAGEFGGVFVEIPRTESTQRTALAENGPLDQRLAWEVEHALETLVREHGEELAARPPAPPVVTSALPLIVPAVTGGGPRPPSPGARVNMQLQKLFEIMGSLNAENSREAYRELSAATDPNLKLFGLMGRIGGGETGALLELEKALPTLTPAFNRWHWTTYLTRVNLAGDLPAAHAMARMAIGERPIPGLETTFLVRVVTARSNEFFPYLAVMLQSPEVSIQEFTFQAFCGLTGQRTNTRAKSAGPRARKEESYCPTKIPMEDYQQHRKDLEHWTQWWESHRGELARTTALPKVTAPERYKEAPTYVQMDLPQGVRLQAILPRRNAPPGSPVLPDRVAIALKATKANSKAKTSDVQVWDEVARTVNARLTENESHMRGLMEQVRLQGPDSVRDVALSLDQERQDILRAGVQDLRNRLSVDGWNAVNDLMNRVAGAEVRRVAPPR